MAERSGQASAPREYRLAQILLRVPEGASADDIQRRRAQANELLNQARAPGADFAALAASRSDAPDAMSGGDLGWRVAERIPQIFLEALAGLKTGEVALVRSPNGFHLLKLLDQRNATSAEAAGAKSIQYRARHILIRRDEPGGESAALQKLAEIRQRIASGAVEFAQMARQFSADGTASRGGDLGWVLQGDTVPEFERALQSLQPGQLSEPVATQFGFHLIQLQERRESTGSSERQRSAARQALREQRVDEAYQDWLRQLRDRTYVEIRLDER
jgi:peptidyl-prolyl cis-trans isomerase SurA